MALTINSTTPSTGQPSAPARLISVNVTPDNSYPTGGYDLSVQLAGGTVIDSELRPVLDGATLRWARISSAGKLQFFADATGSPGAEVANATDLSAIAAFSVWAFVD